MMRRRGLLVGRHHAGSGLTGAPSSTPLGRSREAPRGSRALSTLVRDLTVSFGGRFSFWAAITGSAGLMVSMSTGQIVVYATSYSDLLVQERAQSGTFTDIVDATRESRPRRSIALLSFDEARLTHAGIATRDSTRVATGKVRVRFHELREIVPVRISDLAEGLPSRLRHHFELSLSRRWVPPRTWEACRRLITTDLRNQQILEELERLIEGVERAIPAGRLRVLEEERDALGLALGIFGPRPQPDSFSGFSCGPGRALSRGSPREWSTRGCRDCTRCACFQRMGSRRCSCRRRDYF